MDLIRQRLKERGVSDDIIEYALEPQGKMISVVLDYSPNSHAIFGDFRDEEEFKKFLKYSGGIKFNKYLRYGPGWVMSKKRLREVENSLEENNLEYRTIGNVEYNKEFEGL